MARGIGIPGRVLRSSVRGLADDETRLLLAELLASPALRQGCRAMVESAADGVLDALDDETRAVRMQELAADVSAVAAEIAAERIAPLLIVATREAVAQVLAPLRDVDVRDEAGGAVAELARASGAALAAGMRDELAGAVRAELGPALRGALRDVETRAALAEVARETARAAALGMSAGMNEVSERRSAERIAVRSGGEPDRRGPLVRELDLVARRSRRLTGWLSLAIGLGSIGALAYLVRGREATPSAQ